MKILYRISQLSHQRVFEKLVPIEGVEQIIVGPVEIEEEMPNYGYKDFGIQNIIQYSGNEELAAIIKNEAPDVYVDSVLSFFRKKTIFNSIPKTCILAYLHHGFCSKASVPTYRLHQSVYDRTWMENAKLFSVACGDTSYFYDWMDALGLTKDKIVLNAIPQLDLLYDSNYYNSKKAAILSKIGVGVDTKTILYFGRFGGPGKEFDATNKEFLEVLFRLHDIATKHNMLLLVKPKLHPDQMLQLLKTHMKDTYKTCGTKLIEIMKSNNVYFIDTNRHAYQYLFADVVVLNGASSAELESIIAGRPTITINTVSNIYVQDIFDAIACGASIGVTKMNDLDIVIKDILESDKTIGLLSAGREKIMSKYNIIHDGNAHMRAQNAIIKLKVG